MSVENRVAVVTGATGALGTTVSRTLAAGGASLALLDIDPARLAPLAEGLKLPESRLLARTADLLDPDATRAAAEAAAARFGKLEILLHLVGGWTGGKALAEAPASDLDSMLKQHVWTTFNVLQAFAPHLIQNGWGRVVMITSPYATRPNAKGGPYAAAKAGQEALLLALSQELKGTGVTANLLQARTIDVKREKVSNPTPDNASWTTPEELTASILFLLSEEAAMINGARIPVFGSY
jgi:NAD(P)-dependent dehydrogenase (short-subunit alcohol dehydrogenase family)